MDGPRLVVGFLEIRNAEKMDEKRSEIHRKQDKMWNLTSTLLGVTITIMTGVTGWTINQVVVAHEMLTSLDRRVVTIESSRFTARDGFDLVERMHKIEAAMPKEVPPAWFVKEVRDIEKRIEKLERKK